MTNEALIAEARRWVREEAEASGPLDWPPPVARLADALEKAGAEVEEFKKIRALLIRSLVRATGETEEAVSDAPLTCAVRTVARLVQAQTRIAELEKTLRRAVNAIQPNDEFADSRSNMIIQEARKVLGNKVKHDR